MNKTNPFWGLALNLLGLPLFAQPANNNCSSPSTLTNLDNGCVNATTAAATYDTYRGSCMDGANNVWFRFVAQGPTATINITGGSGSRPEVAVIRPDGGPCDINTNIQVACATGSGNYTTVSTTAGGLTIGQEYYVMVTNRSNGTAGSFQLCINNPQPVAQAGQDCQTKLQVCSNTPIQGNSQGFATQELDATNRGCLAGNERNSSWFYFTAQTSGTLTFQIRPRNGTDDYDFAVWGPNSNCPPTAAPTRCSWAAFPRSMGCGTSSNPTGLTLNLADVSEGACADGQVRHLDVLAGQQYIMVIDGFNPQPGTFDLNWGGTASLDCIVLSANLTSFVGKKEGKNHLLNWTTAQELYTDRFVLQRSSNGLDWQDLHTQAAQGISSEPQHYQFTDASPLFGLNYYRLVIYDEQGHYDYSRVVALHSELENHPYLHVRSVYPQPAKQVLNLEWQAGECESVAVKIFDMMGRLVHQEILQTQDGLQTHQLQLSNLSNGVYLLQLHDEQNQVQFNQKIILE